MTLVPPPPAFPLRHRTGSSVLARHAAIVLVQPIVSTDTGTSLTLANPPSTGDALVLVAGGGQSANPGQALVPGSVSGGGVSTWTSYGSRDGSFNGAGADVWWGIVGATPSATVSFSWDILATSTNTQASLLDFANVNTADQNANQGSLGQSQTPVTPTITPAVSSELFIASAACGVPNSLVPDATFTSSITAGWTLIGATGKCGLGAYLISTDAAAHAATFGLSTNKENWVANIASFEPF